MFDPDEYWEARNLPPALKAKIGKLERQAKWGDGIVMKHHSVEDWQERKAKPKRTKIRRNKVI